MRLSVLSALVFALCFLLFGCVQGSMPQQCSGMSGDRLTNCVYIRAVTDQNPFNCYSIGALDARKTCISDASSTAMKTKIAGMAQNERDALFIGKQTGSNPLAPSNASASYGSGLPSEPAIPQPNATAEGNVTTLDQQLFLHAVDVNDIQLCEQIGDYEIMRSCISQVARQKKVLSICDTLSTPDNIDLCRMYTQGGEKG